MKLVTGVLSRVLSYRDRIIHATVTTNLVISRWSYVKEKPIKMVTVPRLLQDDNSSPDEYIRLVINLSSLVS
jgi:hypothetical protein